MPKILLVGQDLRLMATRAAVLAKVDASIICCTMVDVFRTLESETFDLVVLCHSLSESQIVEISDVIHRRWPKTKILMVVSNISQERRYKDFAFDATSLPDPPRLIDRTAELLEGRPYPSIVETRRVERRQVAS